MTLTIDLQPDIERGLIARAQAKGVSLAAFAQEVLSREAHVSALPAPAGTGQDLIDACASVRGLLTNEEIDEAFSRNRSPARPVDFS